MNWRTELVLEHRINATVVTDAHATLDAMQDKIVSFTGLRHDEAAAVEELDYKYLAVSPNAAIRLKAEGNLIVDRDDFEAVLVFRYAYSIGVASVARAEALTTLLDEADLLDTFAVVQVRRTLQ